MVIVQILKYYKTGGTEKIMDILSSVLSKKHEVYSWIPSAFGSLSKNFIFGELLPKNINPDVFIIHCGILQIQDYEYLGIFDYNIPIICVLHRLEKVNRVPGVYYIAVSNAVNCMQLFDCKVIYNPSRFLNNNTECLRSQSSKIVIARHCRYSMEKNWEAFIQIINSLLLTNTNIEVRILGRQYGMVDGIISKWAEDKPVYLFDWNEDESRVMRFLDECDIYLETSINESFGMGLVEAASMKKPVVCLASPATSELLGDLCVNSYIEASTLIMKLIKDKNYRNEFAERCYSLIPKTSIEQFALEYETYAKECVDDYRNKHV